MPLRYNSFLAKILPAARQLGPLPATGLCAVLALAAGFYGAWSGEGGHALAAALATFSIFLFVMLLTASRGVKEQITASAGSAAGILLSLTLFLAYLIYVLGTNTFALPRVAAVLALIFVPLALAIAAERRPAGTWQDFVIVASVWVTVKFSSARWFWPYPGGKFSYAFTVLVMVNVGIAVFLLTRRLGSVGYSIEWGHRWGLYTAGSFLVFGCVAIPLGLALHFLQFAPRWSSAASLPLVTVGILIFTAWPEEFLFRGLLQNILSQKSKSDLASWCIASVFFGLSHITNGHFPNWRYVLLATLAGLFYGWAWRKTGSIFASALVHALVDATWHFLFRTL
ncbi:MAG: CPBP family intramembrane glutamic endopeptidase [Candidatus Acidiferrum sp.]|jgi:membrane protease YdiL (CAAX protease family)